ncbi:hypothetical protein [Cryptosporangium sp. NPDC048952]|uniref:hypothetical protein n=1 Tax=Cryptosporangium sp. NPDC048952 TaxID=3363961 RepID=UPI0037115F55
MAGPRDDAGDGERHLSRAPAYWDDLDDTADAVAPTFDVRSTSLWDAPLPPQPTSDVPEEPDEPPEQDGTAPEEPLARPGPVARAEDWLRDRQNRLLWIAAFVVGTLLGGAAVHSWETQAADAARRDTVQVTARVAEDAASSASWTGTRQPWTLRIVLTNTGPGDVRLQNARLDDDRYTSNLRQVSRGVRIPAGDETWISMDVTHSCAQGGPATAPRDVILTVAPDDRPERDVQVRLADDNTLIVDTARQKCQTVASEVWITSELVGEPADLDTTLVTPIRIRQHDRRAIALRELRTPTPGLSMVASTRPVSFVEDLTPVTALRWSVADCAKARVVVYAEVGISAVVQLADAGPSLRTAIVLDANAVLAIVRFITRSCG